MAVLTMLTEWDGVAALGMSPVYIPSVSSAVLTGGLKYYLLPSDKHLNNVMKFGKRDHSINIFYCRRI
jgi:hypothetical protein